MLTKKNRLPRKMQRFRTCMIKLMTSSGSRQNTVQTGVFWTRTITSKTRCGRTSYPAVPEVVWKISSRLLEYKSTTQEISVPLFPRTNTQIPQHEYSYQSLASFHLYRNLFASWWFFPFPSVEFLPLTLSHSDHDRLVFPIAIAVTQFRAQPQPKVPKTNFRYRHLDRTTLRLQVSCLFPCELLIFVFISIPSVFKFPCLSIFVAFVTLSPDHHHHHFQSPYICHQRLQTRKTSTSNRLSSTQPCPHSPPPKPPTNSSSSLPPPPSQPAKAQSSPHPSAANSPSQTVPTPSVTRTYAGKPQELANSSPVRTVLLISGRGENWKCWRRLGSRFRLEGGRMLGLLSRL